MRSHCLQKRWFWRETGLWAGVATQFVEGSQAGVMTQPLQEPQSVGSGPCCQMMGQVIGLRVATVPEESLKELGFQTGAQAQLLDSVMEAET